MTKSLLLLSDFEDILLDRIEELRGRIHKAHNPIYNETLMIEIETLQWVLSQVDSSKQYHIDHNLDSLLQSLERKYNIYRPVRSKILSVYYPEDFIPMHSLEMVETVLRSFGKPTDNVHGRLFLAQAQLLEIKNSHPIMKQWHNNDFSHFSSL